MTMANYQSLISNIQNNINANGNNEITGTLLQNVLVSMITALGAGYQFVGIATPATNPSTPDERVFMLGSSGTYPNFGPAEIPSGNLGVFYYDGSGWHYGAIEFPIGDGSITKAKLAQSLLEELLSGYVYGGVATIEGNPGTPERDCFYLTISAGTYPNYGNLTVAMGELAILLFSTTNGWSKESIPISTLFQIVNNLTDGGTDKALSAEMGKYIKEMLGNVGIEWGAIDLNSYSTNSCSLGQSGWYSGGTHKAIPVNEGDVLRLQLLSTESGNSFYGWLTNSYSPPYSDGASIPYVSGTGRVSVQVGSSNILTVPEGASYIVLVIKDGAGKIATWSLDKATSGSGTVEYQLNQLSARLNNVDIILNGEDDSVLLEWSQAVIQSSNRYYRYVNVPVRKGDVINISVNDFSTFQVAVAVTNTPSYSGTVISDTGWKSQAITKVINADEDGRYCRIIIRYANNANITIAQGEAAISVLSATRYAEEGGLIDRVSALENPVQSIPFKNLGGLDYVGRKIDVSVPRYAFLQIGALASGVSSRQGGAVYGNYFFQFHNTLASVVVFRLDTAENVQVISLTAITNCHAGSGGFSGVFYNQSDPFPLLYISSMDEKRIYVFRITGTEGALTMTLVQTITLSVPFYLPNIAIDAANGRGVIFGYKENSWGNPSANYSIICSFELPTVGEAAVTVSKFDGAFRLPFLYAQQGACARWGKLYLSFGNTRDGLSTGGVVVIDYTIRNVDSYLDLLPLSQSSFEPEAIGIWDNGLVISEANGGLYKLTF